ncbi:hypothetical protein BDEG_27192 [Batrachochytrium dendrobatidis JEL423]|nr:hypothetical protein BDEG_27192 [Batrachochytrium dendrobatidis JEL423]
MDVLYSNGVIPSNEIGLQLCPYDMTSDSFINIGNTDITPKCGTDGKSVAWVESPTTDRHTVNIKNILIDDEQANLPAEFQKKTRKEWTGAIRVKSILFRNKLGKIAVKNRLQGNYLISKFGFKIDWDKLPTVSIVMFAQTPVTDANCNSVVTIKLGPKDYIQRADSKNFVFIVTTGSNDKAVLGISFMTRLTMTFDRRHKRIGFGPGCGCEVMADGYPTISNGYQMLWPLPR